MTDYTQATDFSDKDALISGDPEKAISGADIDGELSLIATAVNSKIDEPGSPSTGDSLVWNGSSWEPDNVTTPTGAITAYGGSSAPSGWLLCDGTAVSRTTYSALFAIVSTTFGVGDGSTTFNLPDLEGRVPAGKEASATRLTSGGGGVDGATLGATGGSETHTLTEAQMPSHVHNYYMKGSNVGGTDYPPLGDNTGNVFNRATDSRGSDEAHANVQPTLIVNYIIKT